MALAFDAVGPSATGQTATNPASLTWAHTVTGSQTALAVFVIAGTTGSDATKTISGVTYNGVAMTPVLVKHANNSTAGYVALYTLTNPTTGTHNVVVTFASAPAVGVAGSISHSGVDQTTSYGAPVSAAGDSTLATAAFASNTSGNQILFGVGCGSDTGTNPTSPATKRIQNNFSNSTGCGTMGVATIPATGSSVTCSWSVVSDFWALIAVEVKAAGAGGASLTLGQVVETEFAFALSKTKTGALGEPAEADSAFTITRQKVSTFNQPAETDLAFSVGRVKSASLGLASEADSALPLTPSKAGALGLAASTEQPPSLSGSKSRVLGLTQETDTPLALVPTKTLPLGLTQEADTVFGVSFARAVALGLVQEDDLVFSLDAAKSVGLGLPSEESFPFGLSPAKTLAMRLLAEIDLAMALDPTKSREFGQVEESGLAQAILENKSKQFGLAVETDLVLPLNLTGAVSFILGLVVETESVFPLANATKTRPLGQPLEVDTTSVLDRARSLTLGLPAEVDQLFAIGGTKAVILGLTVEDDIALALDLDTGGVEPPPGPVLRVYRHGVPIDVSLEDLVVVRGGVAVPVVDVEVVGHGEG